MNETVYGKECETQPARDEDRAYRDRLDKVRADYELRQHTATEKGCDSPRPLGIRERIDRALYAAQHTSRRAAIAHRAKQIIDQHPEFAELLDLLNDL